MTDQPGWWKLHDVIVGGLAGGAVGVIAGLFGLRLVEHPGVPLTGGAIGAAVGVAWLRRAASHRFFTRARATAWVLSIAAVVFLAVLARAISTFS